MTELKIFNNPEFGEIRTVEVAGEPWLVGTFRTIGPVVLLPTFLVGRDHPIL